MSYATAESQERLETDEIALGEDEAIGYATVDKECGSVSNGNGCNEKTAFSADVRYIYQKTDGTITAIDNLANVKYISRKFRMQRHSCQIQIFIRKSMVTASV